MFNYDGALRKWEEHIINNLCQTNAIIRPSWDNKAKFVVLYLTASMQHFDDSKLPFKLKSSPLCVFNVAVKRHNKNAMDFNDPH